MLEVPQNAEREPLAALDRALAWIGATLLLVITMLTIGSVLGRALLGRPIPDSDGISEMLSAVAVFFGFAYVQLTKGHVEVTIASDWLPARALEWLKFIALILTLLAFSTLALGMAIGTYEAWDFNDVYVGEYEFVTWPARFLSTLGAFVLVLRLAIDLALQFRRARQGPQQPAGDHTIQSVPV